LIVTSSRIFRLDIQFFFSLARQPEEPSRQTVESVELGQLFKSPLFLRGNSKIEPIILCRFAACQMFLLGHWLQQSDWMGGICRSIFEFATRFYRISHNDLQCTYSEFTMSIL
jgi:hypothetical protein